MTQELKHALDTIMSPGFGEAPEKRDAAEIMVEMLAESHIQARRNAVEVCGSMTGHTYRAIAYCDDPLSAHLLAEALKAYVATKALASGGEDG